VAKIANEPPASIASQMADGDAEITEWLKRATFAEASTGHWLAWRVDSPDLIAVLSPDHVEGDKRHWLDIWDDETLETAIARIESGEFDRVEAMELNLFIDEPESTPALPSKNYSELETARAYLNSFVDQTVDYSDPKLILERLELIYKQYGEGELKGLFEEASNAFVEYALRVSA
jgi:hypothetical protein